MKVFNLLAIMLFLMIGTFSCNSQTMQNRMQSVYEEYRNKFPKALISHFPSEILLDSAEIIRKERISYNDIGLLLYEYGQQESKIDSIVHSIMKVNPIVQYHSYDTCLLIVNMFESRNTIDNYFPASINDSTLIERECYSEMLPIPNFVDFQGHSETRCALDSTFTIYVFEAKSGNYFEYFETEPFKHMPKKWENGYSRGIAISKKNRAIIYWGIIW